MAGKFEIYTDKAGEYRFRLKDNSGKIVLSSEGYKAKSSCVSGVKSVQISAVDENRYDQMVTKSGMYKFNLKAGNGRVIGVSQGVKSQAECNACIESVKRVAPSAIVDDISG